MTREVEKTILYCKPVKIIVQFQTNIANTRVKSFEHCLKLVALLPLKSLQLKKHFKPVQVTI